MAGHEVISGHVDGMVYVWDAESGEPVSHIKAHERAITCMACDSTRVVTGAADKTVTVRLRRGELAVDVNNETAVGMLARSMTSVQATCSKPCVDTLGTSWTFSTIWTRC